MSDFFKKILRNKIIMAVISIIFGIVLIAGQGSAVAGIIRILGVLLLIGAIVGLITYFFGKDNKGNPSTLAGSILCILVSVIFIYTPNWLVYFFPIFMGIVLIINSIFTISALVSSPIRTGMFTASMILSILSLILGFIAVLHPAAMADVLTIFIGVTCLFNGINDLLAIAVLK